MNANDAFSLANETALITGGGSGLGFGIAQAFTAAGARVVILGRNEERLKAATDKLGPRASYLVHDVTQIDQADAALKQATDAAGSPITILVNNAGVHLKKPAIEITNEELQTVINTHVIAAHALTREALPGMIARQHGQVLFISSMSALFGIPYVMAYSTAKTGMIGMVRSLAAEVSADGIRVNAIAPGWIDSDMMRNALADDEARKQKILSRTPMGRFGEADDIGWAAVYLCSPAAKFVTGVVLPVDGGVSIGF